jgi:hypothetical protein
MPRRFYPLLIILFSCWMTGLFAATVSGFVTRKESAEPLQYVNMKITETKAGSQTNKKGYYVINVSKPGTYTLTASLISFTKITQSFEVKNADDEIVLDIEMDKSSVEMAKVVVTGKLYDNNDVNTPHIKVSTEQMTTEDILNTVSVAEADVFRSILTLPGVTPISDFSSGLYVRGGSPDQNLILIDDIDVYNPNHFGGVFSTFNSDAVESVELLKGGFPAQYGGRMSSVLDVTNRQGNRNFHQGVGRLSLISASSTLEGPWKLGSQSGSYMGSFRRTYLDFVEKAFDLPDYYFYDGHWKLNWDVDNKNKLSTSMYFGKDNLDMDFGAKLHLDWGNKTFSTQWTHIFNPTLFSHFVFAGSNFESNFKQISDGEEAFNRNNSIDDLTLKGMYSWKATNSHLLDFGMETKWNRTQLKMKTAYSIDPNALPDVDVKAITGALYLQDIWDINEFWTLQPGIRASLYKSLDINLPSCPDASYLNVEPRVSLRRKLDVAENVFFTYGRYYQYLTVMSMQVSTPFDVWFPLDGSLNPGMSDHYIVGYVTELNDNLNFDAEVYYKTYNDILEYNPATDYTWNNQTGQLSDTFNVGKGYTYGADFMIRNDWQGLEGFIGYTLSKTRRKMDAVNINPDNLQPQYFYPAYDKTHQLNMVETYNLTENTGIQILGSDFRIGTNVSYSTGQPQNKPEGIYFDGENAVLMYSYTDRERLPAYFRIDLSTKFEYQKSWGTIEPYFEVINVLNHKNVGGRAYYTDQDENGEFVLKHTDQTQFPFLPFVGVNVKW